MSNALDDNEQQQICALGRLGWPLLRIQRATGVRRETVNGYLKAAGIPVRGRGRPSERNAKPAITEGVSTDSESTPAISREVSTDAPPTRAPSASACEAYRELIEEAVGRGRNAVAIYQDLVDDHGFTAKYASVKRFIAKLRGTAPAEARVVITTAAGEAGQVDYGEGPMVRWPATGKYRRTRLFVFTLGCSRKAVRLLTWRSSTQIWCELHERAFRRLGGTTTVIVLDTLKEGVLTPDIYDPALNPLYRDMLAHDGVVALPCRVGDPDRKGKVEAGVGHTQKTPLQGQRFETIEAAQAYLDRWEAHWADTRIHGTTKRQVAVMLAEERPALGPLPIEPFRYYQFGERTVHLDGCVEIEAAFYAPPPGWIGRRVHVQWNDLHVRLIAPKTHQLLREHLRAPRGHHRVERRQRIEPAAHDEHVVLPVEIHDVVPVAEEDHGGRWRMRQHPPVGVEIPVGEAVAAIRRPGRACPANPAWGHDGAFVPASVPQEQVAKSRQVDGVDEHTAAPVTAARYREHAAAVHLGERAGVAVPLPG
jgi:transposase